MTEETFDPFQAQEVSRQVDETRLLPQNIASAVWPNADGQCTDHLLRSGIPNRKRCSRSYSTLCLRTIAKRKHGIFMAICLLRVGGQHHRSKRWARRPTRVQTKETLKIAGRGNKQTSKYAMSIRQSLHPDVFRSHPSTSLHQRNI